MLTSVTRPGSDIDPFSDAALDDPYPRYAELRRIGGAVWLDRYEIWAIPRWETLTQVSRDHQRFRSGQGIGFTPMPPDVVRNTLVSDEPLHSHLRSVVADKLLPTAVRRLESRIDEEAERLVTDLLAMGDFDAVRDLAWRLPLSIVTELVGVPPELGTTMLEWTESRANSFGPRQLPRTQDGLAKQAEFAEFTAELMKRENLRPGSMSWGIYEAVDRGDIEPERAPALMRDYLGPSLDTTVTATGNLFWLLANNPDQWGMLRDNPALAPQAVNEGLRMESPIQFFMRTAVEDVEIAGTTIRAGERTLLMYGSANRDERKWDSPERMDIGRKGVGEHLAFGVGIHFCVGRVLAQMEIRAIFAQLARRARTIEVVGARRSLNNFLRTFTRLDARITAG